MPVLFRPLLPYVPDHCAPFSPGSMLFSDLWPRSGVGCFSIIAGNFLASMPKGPEKLQAAGMHKSFGAILLH